MADYDGEIFYTTSAPMLQAPKRKIDAVILMEEPASEGGGGGGDTGPTQRWSDN